jgi:4-hydroxybenzoate polyprenyltransferase
MIRVLPQILRRGLRSTAVFLGMIRVAHSIFALPFALASLLMATSGRPGWPLLGKTVLAVVLARTAAMSFNRWADAALDGRNRRTGGRAIPAGLLSRGTALGATVLCSGLFVLAAAWINRTALALSPAALLVLLGYSYTKRFTRWSHLVLGLALGLAPVGAWVAARDGLALLPCLLGAAVLLWTAGFDIIYACQDMDFDRAEGLRSIPERWGMARALLLSRILHAASVGLLLAVGAVAPMGWIHGAGVGLVALLLAYEQSLVRPGDLSRVDQAFFAMNGLVSLAYLGFVVLATLLGDRPPPPPPGQ